MISAGRQWLASALVNAKRSTSNGVVKIVVVLLAVTVNVVRTVRRRGCLVSSYRKIHESSNLYFGAFCGFLPVWLD